jgi:hypothetical protein
LSPAKASTVLLRQYLEGRVGIHDRRESAACRAFLHAYNATVAAVQEYNRIADPFAQFGVERQSEPVLVACRGTEPDSAVVRVRGREELPSLVLPMTAALAHIIRETGPCRVAFDVSGDRKPASPDPEREPRRGFPSKPEARLIPGRKA